MAVLKIYNALSVIITVARFINTDSKIDGDGRKVMDGIPTTIDQFPHSVLLYVTGNKTSHKCGSSVLNQAVLLTAAHCVRLFDKTTQRMEVFAGHKNFKKSRVCREIKTFLWHPGYPGRVGKHDIAILILKNPLPLGDNIKRVIIKAQFPNIDYAVLAGWGRIYDNKPTSLLQTAIQNILPSQTCTKYARKKNVGVFCAGDPKGVLGQGAKGDSGCALMTGFQQIGIVSFKTHSFDRITYYTNISHYYTWIKMYSEETYCRYKKTNTV